MNLVDDLLATLLDGHLRDVRIGAFWTAVGHFPFIDHVRPLVKTLWTLEQKPNGDNLPAESVPQIIPQADVLAITARSSTIPSMS